MVDLDTLGQVSLVKSKIIENVMENTGFNKKTSTQAVEDLLEIIKGSLEKGEDVLISRFGKMNTSSELVVS